MDQEIDIPTEVPVMTLPNTVLFPQAILPLYIFESRYRLMLKDVLDSHRIFAIAGLHQNLADPTPEQEIKVAAGQPEDDYFEPTYETATVGMVRACHENDDGTSNLILQGLVRVRFDKITTEVPYRKALITPLFTKTGDNTADFDALRSRLLRKIERKQSLGGKIESEVYTFLRKIHDPDVFIDLASFSLVQKVDDKQKLLETLETSKRFKRFQRIIDREIETLVLYNKLKGNLSEDDISNN